MRSAELSGQAMELLLKDPVEAADASKTGFQSDLRNSKVGLQQKPAGLIAAQGTNKIGKAQSSSAA